MAGRASVGQELAAEVVDVRSLGDRRRNYHVADIHSY